MTGIAHPVVVRSPKSVGTTKQSVFMSFQRKLESSWGEEVVWIVGSSPTMTDARERSLVIFSYPLPRLDCLKAVLSPYIVNDPV